MSGASEAYIWRSPRFIAIKLHKPNRIDGVRDRVAWVPPPERSEGLGGPGATARGGRASRLGVTRAGAPEGGIKSRSVGGWAAW